MRKLKMIGFVAAMALMSTTTAYAQESKSDSFAKTQLEKMKEFQKHRLSK